MAFSLLARFSLLALPLASALSVSRQIQLEDVDYFVPPEPAWNLDAWDSKDVNDTDEFVPLSAIILNSTANAQRVRAMLEAYNTTDDVWTPSFSQVLYIQAPSQQPEDDSWTSDLAPDYDVSSVYYSSNSSSTVPPGPYLVERSTGDVYQAYRLYVDTNQAFLQSTYQDPSGKHHTVHAASSSAGGLTIAVPSRLYFTPTKKQPLAGVRLAVKDLFDLDGVKTSGGNRALYAMSGVKNETAVPVQKLIDAGAIVIGKNKLSEFAFAGPYVTEHIDYLLPFNPRGDGYNSPGDSSGGSAASVASYDWLDVSMGSDTGGSVRGPASNNGVFGNRPTHGAVNLNGSLVLSSSMDTAGLIARDPIVWSEVSKVLYSGLDEYREFPTQIYVDPSALQYLSEAEDQYPDLVETAEKFIDALATLISGNASVFSIDQAWNETAPSALGNASLAGLVNAIYGNLTRYEQWFEFGQDFVESYMSTHDGDFPHMVPGTRQGWLQANATMTEQSHADDLEYKQSISDWVDTSLFPSDNQSCSNAIYLYFTFPNVFKYKVDVSDDSSNPYISDLISSNQQQSMTILQLNATINCNTTLGSQEACDEVLKIIEESEEQSSAPSPVSPGRLASVAGLPDFALTLTSLDLGELTYSNSTLQNQSLPLAVDIVAGKGCDFMLFNLIEKMNEEGIIRKVNTGPIP